jgi:hypothetical protein
MVEWSMGGEDPEACGATFVGFEAAFLVGADLVAAFLAGIFLLPRRFLVAGFFFGDGIVMPGMFMPACPECCATAGVGNDRKATEANATVGFIFKTRSIAG